MTENPEREEQQPRDEQDDDPGEPGAPTTEPRGNQEPEQDAVEQGNEKLDRIAGN